MNIKPIHTERQYKKSLQRIAKLWDAKKNTPEADECEILFALVEVYEREHYPIAPPNPIDAIKFRMDQLGLKNSDLTKYFGYKSRTSEILSGKRKLTVSMMQKMHTQLGVPAEALLAE